VSTVPTVYATVATEYTVIHTMYATVATEYTVIHTAATVVNTVNTYSCRSRMEIFVHFSRVRD